MFERQHLHKSLQGIGIEPKINIFADLVKAYGERGRYYHTQQHIAQCLADFAQVRHLAEYPSEIEIALWFHDAIYNTRRSDNEEMSAQWAKKYLFSENANPEVIQRIVQMIMATKTHQENVGDTALLIDVDLGILGASKSTFEEYDRSIRLEYEWVPEEEYRIGRIEVLRSFLNRDAIYNTSEFRNSYEAQARSNLSDKIKQLSN